MFFTIDLILPHKQNKLYNNAFLYPTISTLIAATQIESKRQRSEIYSCVHSTELSKTYGGKSSINNTFAVFTYVIIIELMYFYI